jgi:uncharacterized protein YuzE
MKLRYDKDVDALFVRFSDETIVDSEEVRPGFVLDYDAAGHIIGIEILDAGQQLTAKALAGMQAAE